MVTVSKSKISTVFRERVVLPTGHDRPPQGLRSARSRTAVLSRPKTEFEKMCFHKAPFHKKMSVLKLKYFVNPNKLYIVRSVS